MKAQKFTKRIFLKDKISLRIIPLLSMHSSGNCFDTALGLEHTTCTCSLHPKWTNKNGNHKSNSRFITLPFVALAVVQSSSRAAPICKQRQVDIISLLKNFCG